MLTIQHACTKRRTYPGPRNCRKRSPSSARSVAAKAGQDYDTFAKARMAEVPANRFGTAEEFGRTCALLCSEHAGFIVGQNLLIDGGAVNVTL